jgi:hypothetical protein
MDFGQRRFLFQTIHDIELMLDRERLGREASPSAAVIGQSVKTLHIAVDPDERLLMVNLTTADISDSAGDPQYDPQTLAEGETSLRRCRLRPAAVDGQGHLSTVRDRNHPLPRRSEGLRSPAVSLGRQTDFRLDNPLAQLVRDYEHRIDA